MFHQRVNTISWSVFKNVPSACVSEAELLDAAADAVFLLELEGFFLPKKDISKRVDACTRRTRSRLENKCSLQTSKDRTGAEKSQKGKMGDTEIGKHSRPLRGSVSCGSGWSVPCVSIQLTLSQTFAWRVQEGISIDDLKKKGGSCSLLFSLHWG